MPSSFPQLVCEERVAQPFHLIPTQELNNRKSGNSSFKGTPTNRIFHV
jgi:hypothetical protein